MKDEVYKFVLASLGDMNYDVTDADSDTAIGPAGVDLESLSIAELGVRIEDQYGVRFEDDEVEQVASMTIGEFVDLVVARHEALAGA
ncbi:MAG TPA: acyl carrier protein [Micromonosporaceae bacterium]|nr:acyl carrier protein [Micromonosporaceae bacterium]